MKNLSVSKLFIGLFILLFTTGIHAQDKGINPLPPVTVTTPSSVNKKVMESFQSSFKDAVSPAWYRLNKNYLVEFIIGDMKNRALYKKNGSIVYQISYGHESNLPREVRRLVKSSYIDFNIVQAINVQEDDRNIWVVNLEDNNRFIMVRVEDEALEEVSSINKTR